MVQINVRVDEDVKRGAERVCQGNGRVFEISNWLRGCVHLICNMSAD